MFVLADDELFEFCVSCVKFGENRRVFVEFVGSVIFVDLKLSQNPLLPTTNAQFSVRENLEICHFFCEVANFKIHSPQNQLNLQCPIPKVSIPFSKTILLSSFALRAIFTIFSVKM